MNVNTGACGLDQILQSVLSVALQEQNNVYPAFIFQSQFNVVTSLLISELVKAYPDSPEVLDMLDPFVKFSMQPVDSGYVTLPDDYRNLLGSPYIFLNKNGGECGDMPKITTPQQFKSAISKGACQATSISLIAESEFAIRTSSKYKYPSQTDPVGYFSGKRQIKVCPFDLTKVAILYVRNEKKCVYTYYTQPDDTFIFNPNDPALQDSEWTNAAFKPIFTAMCSLFSAYTRDNELRDWSRILHNEGIL